MLFDTEFNYDIFLNLNINDSLQHIKNTLKTKNINFYQGTKHGFFFDKEVSENLINQLISFDLNSESESNFEIYSSIKSFIDDLSHDMKILDSSIYSGTILAMIEDNFIEVFDILKTHKIDYSMYLKDIKDCVNNIVLASKEINEFSLKSKQLIKDLTLFIRIDTPDIKPKLLKNLNEFQNYFNNKNIMSLLNHRLDNTLGENTEKLIKIRNNCIYDYLELRPTQAYMFSFKNLNPIQKIIIKRNTVFKEELSTKQTIDGYYKFDDGSVAFRIKGEYIPILSNEEYKENFKTLIECKLKDVLRKNPTLFKPFNKLLNDNFYTDNGQTTFSVVSKLLNNHQLIKSGLGAEEYQNLIKYLATDIWLENFDDKLSAIIKTCTAKQNLRQITSAKNRHILDDQSANLYEKLMDLETPLPDINQMISKKISLFNSAESFNTYLTSVLNNLSGFNKELILKTSNELNTDILIDNQEYLILKIKNYDESVKLGSPNWCIKRDEYYFDRYVNESTFQYFVFDFNKSLQDKDSLIGITLYRDGKFYTAHDRDDSSIEKSKINKIINNILNKEGITLTTKNKLGAK